MLVLNHRIYVRNKVLHVVIEGAKWWMLRWQELEAACGIIKAAKDIEFEKDQAVLGRRAWHRAQKWAQRLQFICTIVESKMARVKLSIGDFHQKRHATPAISGKSPAVDNLESTPPHHMDQQSKVSHFQLRLTTG